MHEKGMCSHLCNSVNPLDRTQSDYLQEKISPHLLGACQTGVRRTRSAGDPTATDTAMTAWTHKEHERFVQGVQLYPDGSFERIAQWVGTKTAAEVESYGLECLAPDAYLQLRSRCESKQDAKAQNESEELPEETIKVELTEVDAKNELEEEQPPAMNQCSGAAGVKRHRVRKWLRRALTWCVDALSFRCLRRQKKAGAYAESGYSDREEVWYGGGIPLRHRGASVREPTHAPTPDYAFGALLPREPEARDTPLRSGPWSSDEHERYCEGLELYRYGSWRLIADYVGTRSVRQVMSHAQSIRAKRKRARESERNHAPSKPRPFRVAAVPSGNPTPEEILNASMSRSISNGVMSGVSSNVGEAKTFHSDVLSIALTSSFASKKSSGGDDSELQEHALFLPSTSANSEKAVQSLPLTTENCARHPDEDLDLDDEAPLCSPPHDILQGSFLSDEDLLELFNSPQTPSVSQFHRETS